MDVPGAEREREKMYLSFPELAVGSSRSAQKELPRFEGLAEGFALSNLGCRKRSVPLRQDSSPSPR